MHYTKNMVIYKLKFMTRLLIELAQKDVILLSEVFIVVYKAGKRTSVGNKKLIHFNLSTGTY